MYDDDVTHETASGKLSENGIIRVIALKYASQVVTSGSAMTTLNAAITFEKYIKTGST